MFRRSRSRHAFSENCLGILKTVVQVICCAAPQVICCTSSNRPCQWRREERLPVVLGLPRLAWVPRHVPSMNPLYESRLLCCSLYPTCTINVHLVCTSQRHFINAMSEQHDMLLLPGYCDLPGELGGVRADLAWTVAARGAVRRAGRRAQHHTAVSAS